jgi:ribulose-bisphosphate carboxylase large chain
VSRLIAHYRIRSKADSIEARAQALAIEQSVEMPVDAIDDAAVLTETVGQVAGIEDLGNDSFAVRIALSSETTGFEVGQLLNMLFGNSSIHDEVTLVDAEFPPDLLAAFPGSSHGLASLRERADATGRALTGSALKPQGLSCAALADLAYRMALGGLDIIKDDHGLADQRAAPFAERVRDCAFAVRRAGGRTRYFPSLSGDLDKLRAQVRLALDEGVDGFLVAPMILGLPSVAALVRAFPQATFMAHPAMAGATAGLHLPPDRLRRYSVSQLWWPVRLFAFDLPSARRGGTPAVVGPADRSGSGRRHDGRTRAGNPVILWARRDAIDRPADCSPRASG